MLSAREREKGKRGERVRERERERESAELQMSTTCKRLKEYYIFGTLSHVLQLMEKDKY